ncbi:MAG: DUF177 domain-containing protein [Hyphomicrobiaceae bacterium]|nr:DUF177 domain-containing protein [Hyphomicrobiaceae bacterium]MCC0024490.1 DUF177 domain-containing protein [Hyphomicrobiaceae bacterium]
MSRKPNVPEDLDLVVSVDKLKPAGRDVTFEASDAQCVWLAKTMRVSELADVSATFHLIREAEGLHVTGQLKATSTQPCVVTLEPVTQRIDVALDRRYLPERMRISDPAPSSETYIDLEAEDLPDYFAGDDIDLAPLLLDTLGMEIDLYPRAPGAKLPESGAEEADAPSGPFAGLAKRLGQPDNEN